MHLRRLFCCSLLLGALAAPASAQERTPVPGAANPEFMGMVIRDPYYDTLIGNGTIAPNTAAQDAMGKRLEELGVRWVRLEFLADDGRVDLSRYDYFIGTVAPRHNLKVLGLLNTNIIRRHGDPLGSPYFFNLKLDQSHPSYGGGLNVPMINWLDEALRIADHYDGTDADGTPSPYGRVHAFEILNEVNRLNDGTGIPDVPELAGMTHDGISPEVVATLQAKFYRICKNTDGKQSRQICLDDTAILSLGLHPKGTSTRRTAKEKEQIGITDEQYIQRMYARWKTDFYSQNGNRWPNDGISFHPYPEEIEPRVTLQGAQEDLRDKVSVRLNQVRLALKDFAGANQPFWITEIGFNAGFYKVRGPMAESLQAEFMREAYTTLAARPDVANVFWFKYEDFPQGLDATGKPVGDPQLWGVVSIPFVYAPSVNGYECIGGACYDANGQVSRVRPIYLIYRELAGLPVQKTYLPLSLR